MLRLNSRWPGMEAIPMELSFGYKSASPWTLSTIFLDIGISIVPGCIFDLRIPLKLASWK
jgi:hypothetical protein